MGIKDIEILDKRQNPLLNREEIDFRIVYEGPTPRRNEVRDALIANLKLKPELTILDGVKTRFGSNAATGYVKVYKDRDSMGVEQAHKIKKNFPAEKKKEVKEADEEKKEAVEEKKEVKEKEGEKEAEEKPGEKKEEKNEVAGEDKKEIAEEKVGEKPGKEEDVGKKAEEKTPVKEEKTRKEVKKDE